VKQQGQGLQTGVGTKKIWTNEKVSRQNLNRLRLILAVRNQIETELDFCPLAWQSYVADSCALRGRSF
jgi:hypothetical protein